MSGGLDGSLRHRCAVLALRFGILAIFALGNGASGMIPQMHQEFVTRDHWLDELTFSQLLAVSQAAPGPNFLIVSLIGWRVASWPGAFVVYVAFLAAPLAIAFTVGRLVPRHDTPLLLLVRRAVPPLRRQLRRCGHRLVNDKTPVDRHHGRRRGRFRFDRAEPDLVR